MDEGREISYEALEVGTPVVTSTGTQFGAVEHVLQDPSLDLFDGLAVKTKDGLRFVSRDQVSVISTTMVKCAVADGGVESLPAPRYNVVLHADPAHDEGSSLSARYGRIFGREHWKELEK